ncbi:MAG: hypothetical protein H0U53_10385 [Actinobacteria bacterium]|nr:hypothetical protein [Actinomycetota bacterium]
MAVGATSRMKLGSLGRGICYAAPDFAGSFWLLRSRPRMLDERGGHGTSFTGIMKRTQINAAVFRGHMRHEDEAHRIVLRFKRAPGGWYYGGCA